MFCSATLNKKQKITFKPSPYFSLHIPMKEEGSGIAQYLTCNAWAKPVQTDTPTQITAEFDQNQPAAEFSVSCTVHEGIIGKKTGRKKTFLSKHKNGLVQWSHNKPCATSASPKQNEPWKELFSSSAHVGLPGTMSEQLLQPWQNQVDVPTKPGSKTPAPRLGKERLHTHRLPALLWARLRAPTSPFPCLHRQRNLMSSVLLQWEKLKVHTIQGDKHLSRLLLACWANRSHHCL